MSATSFDQLGLAPALLRAIATLGYETPSSIQAESIPALLEGHDLLGQAQTGTGKTAAFALPVLQRLALEKREPQALVLAPTRELAIQVAQAFESYASSMSGLRTAVLCGGQDYRPQLTQLKAGAQVIVGTPGRVMDHMRKGSLNLDTLRMFVLDEADEMLNMGFVEDIEWVLEHAPEERQVALFSATMPPRIRDIARRHLREPVEIRIAAKTSTASTISQRYWAVDRRIGKNEALLRLLAAEPTDGVIVFVRTKQATTEVAEALEARGITASPINGDMNQPLRERTIERFKSGKLDVLVATDVAARGIDVERVSHVINYDIPFDTEAYVHRVGRTGRAGRSGAAILFVDHREKRMLALIERATRQPITPMALPSAAEIAEQRLKQLQMRVLDACDHDAMALAQERLAEWSESTGKSIDALAAALLCMTAGDQLVIPADEKPAVAVDLLSGAPRGRQREEGAWSERSDGDRPQRERGPRQPKPLEPGMVRYRIAVGRNHDVTPREIVGAIANEAGIEGRNIGPITISGEFSTVDLPDGMPQDVFRHLSTVRVKGQALRLREWTEQPPESRDSDAAPRVRRRETGGFTPRDDAPKKPHRKGPGFKEGGDKGKPAGAAAKPRFKDRKPPRD